MGKMKWTKGKATRYGNVYGGTVADIRSRVQLGKSLKDKGISIGRSGDAK